MLANIQVIGSGIAIAVAETLAALLPKFDCHVS
jgi:hypothetical protein